MSTDVIISSGKHGPLTPLLNSQNTPHRHFGNTILLRWQFSSFIRLAQTCLSHYWYLIAPLRCGKLTTIYYLGNTWRKDYKAPWKGSERLDTLVLRVEIILRSFFLFLVYVVDIPKLVVSLLTRIPIIRKTEITTKATRKLRKAPWDLMDRVRQCMIITGELRFCEL